MQKHTPWKQKQKTTEEKEKQNDSKLGFKKGMLGKFVSKTINKGFGSGVKTVWSL